MTIHALDKNFYLKEIPVKYRDRPKGSISKLNTYKDGFKVLVTITRLFRDYRPFAFFSVIALLFIVFAFGLFVPVLMDYLETGLVPRFPTLIVSGLSVLLGFLFFFCGIVLEVIAKKHKQLYEILMNK